MNFAERMIDVKMLFLSDTIRQMFIGIGALGKETEERKRLCEEQKVLVNRCADLGRALMRIRNTKLLNEWHSRDFYSFDDAKFADYIGFLHDVFPDIKFISPDTYDSMTLRIGTLPVGGSITETIDGVNKKEPFDAEYARRQTELVMKAFNSPCPKDKGEAGRVNTMSPSDVMPDGKPTEKNITPKKKSVAKTGAAGSEKLMLKIETGSMSKKRAGNYIKKQAKVFSRKLDYNSLTGEVTKCVGDKWGARPANGPIMTRPSTSKKRS